MSHRFPLAIPLCVLHISYPEHWEDRWQGNNLIIKKFYEVEYNEKEK